MLKYQLYKSIRGWTLVWLHCGHLHRQPSEVLTPSSVAGTAKGSVWDANPRHKLGFGQLSPVLPRSTGMLTVPDTVQDTSLITRLQS